MAKQIAKLLKTDIMADLDLPGLAQLLESKGRKGDTMLAHITPQEAALLKARGGAGTMNPDTGLPEFYDGDADTYFSPSRAGRTAVDMDNYYTPRQPATSAVPTPDVEMPTPTSPYSFAPNAPAVNLTPPTETYSMDRPTLPAGNAFNVMPSQTPFFDVRRGGIYSPSSVEATQANIQSALAQQAVGGQVADLPTATGAPAQPGVFDRIGAKLRDPKTQERILENIGLTGLQSLPAILMARQAAEQGRRSKEEMQRLAAPYQQQGQALVAQAQRGELTAPAQQQIQALQARAAQGVAARGGVGAEQAAAQVEAFRQQLLQGQFDMGLKVANIGDQIAVGAIRTGLSADQYVNELTGNYFTNIARMAYGQAPQVAQPQTQPVRA